MKNLRLAVVLVLLALLVAAGFWFRSAYEPVQEDAEVGYRGPARLNPFLATERLYTRLGVPAHTPPGAARPLPPPDHALLVLSRRRALSAQQLRALLEWVRQGGRLVIALDEAPRLDPVLAHFGVRVRGTDQSQEMKEPKEETETVAVRLRGGGTATVQVSRTPRLVAAGRPADLTAGSPAGAFLLRFAEGKGMVTILSDASFLDNDRLGERDDANLAWALLQGGRGDRDEGPPRGAVLVVREDLPSLAGLLVQNAWAAVASGLVLLAAWLWQAGARFGPVLPDPPRDRRSLLEHVEAAGQFLWRAGRGADLAAAARQALLHRVEVREPDWLKLPERELAERLAAVAGLSTGRVEAALRSAAAEPADLVTTIQTLETLRRSL